MTIRTGHVAVGFVIRPGPDGVGTSAFIEVMLGSIASLDPDWETYELNIEQAKQLHSYLGNMVDRAEHACGLIDGTVEP